MHEQTDDNSPGTNDRSAQQERFDHLFALAKNEAAGELVDHVQGIRVPQPRAERTFAELGTLVADLGLEPQVIYRLLPDVGVRAIALLAAKTTDSDLAAKLANAIPDWTDRLSKAVLAGFKAANRGIPAAAARWMMKRSELQPHIIEALAEAWPDEVRFVSIVISASTRPDSVPKKSDGTNQRPSANGARALNKSPQAPTGPRAHIHALDHDVLLIGRFATPSPRRSTAQSTPRTQDDVVVVTTTPIHNVRQAYLAAVATYRMIHMGFGAPTGRVACPPRAWPDSPMGISTEDLLLLSEILKPLLEESVDCRIRLGLTLEWALEGQYSQQQIASRLGCSASTISHRTHQIADLIGRNLETARHQTLLRTMLPALLNIWHYEKQSKHPEGPPSGEPGAS